LIFERGEGSLRKERKNTTRNRRGRGMGRPPTWSEKRERSAGGKGDRFSQVGDLGLLLWVGKKKGKTFNLRFSCRKEGGGEASMGGRGKRMILSESACGPRSPRKKEKKKGLPRLSLPGMRWGWMKPTVRGVPLRRKKEAKRLPVRAWGRFLCVTEKSRGFAGSDKGVDGGEVCGRNPARRGNFGRVSRLFSPKRRERKPI